MGFESFLFLLVIVIFIIVYRHKHNYREKISELETRIQLLKTQIELHVETAEQPVDEKIAEAKEPEEKIAEPIPPLISQIHEPQPIQSFKLPEEKVLPTIPQEGEPVSPFETHPFPASSESYIEIEEGGEGSQDKSSEDPPASDWIQRWEEFKANVDWEMFTGVKLFAWLGGLALFIGAGFFVKYSIDRNLIPPALRLAIGAITGLLLIVASGRFDRVRYNVLRHTLAAGGIGVLYSVIFAATLYYSYLSKPLGFGLLTVVSATAFVLAIYYRGIAISVLGALGAYITPILVTTGHGSLMMLFLYLAIINTGLYEVVRRLNSVSLLLIATLGTLCTLSLGTFAGRIEIETSNLMIAGVWIANLVQFSIFLWISKEKPEENQLLSWTGNLLYLSVPIVALGLMNKTGSAPFILVTAGMAGAVGLAFSNQGWFSRVIPYGAITFGVAFLWAFMHFDPQSISWNFAVMLVYGAVGGLGPVILIRKYGLNQINLRWFQVFPVAMGLMLLALVLKNPQISFWFWPMILILELLGILISLLFGAMIQVGLLILFFIISGLSWVLRIPADFTGLGFYGFLLFAGSISSVAIVYALIKLPVWEGKLNLGGNVPFRGSSEISKGMTEWITAFPAMGAFVLLSVTFWIQNPLQPHPGMFTLVCFLSLSLFLSKRLSSQSLSVVALLSAIFAHGIWVFRPGLEQNLFFSALTWSGALFCVAIIMPFIFFKSFEKWSRVWNGWALFEIFQGLFLIWAADHIWPREMSGWSPLILAFMKLPAVAILQLQLRGRPERNAILAFHGGALLFYVSAIPIMLLEQGWLGLTLVFEAMLLLWLNRRVEHEGLRWVSAIMAPFGLLLLFFALPKMKGPDSLIILNGAILSVVSAVAALAFAVKLSNFPQRKLGKTDLPQYFLWLSIGAGFFLVNLIIADLFAEPPAAFKVLPEPDAKEAVCYGLVWLFFGASLWSVRLLSTAMRTMGLALVCLGAGSIILLPFLFPDLVPDMQPLWNLGLPAYFISLIILVLLFIKEPRESSTKQFKNLFLTILLITGFMATKVEMNTLLQPGMPFRLFFGHTASMAVGSAAGWLAYGLGLLLWTKGLDRPFRIAGLILILTGLIKTSLFPFSHKEAFGAMTPLLNYPSLLFLFVIVMLVCLTLNKPKHHWPLEQPGSRGFWGSLLAVMIFFVLNIEISSVFAIKGGDFSLLTHGSLSHQLAYSLGWMVYSIGLLVVGIRWSNIKVRWAALAFLVVTALKIFFMDLWRLGQLYRVASFIGLAAVLILVSFLYQRFLSKGDQNEKTKDN